MPSSETAILISLSLFCALPTSVTKALAGFPNSETTGGEGGGGEGGGDGRGGDGGGGDGGGEGDAGQRMRSLLTLPVGSSSCAWVHSLGSQLPKKPVLG